MAEKEKFDEFLDEVVQDIRQEKFRQLWNKYGKQVSSAVTVVLVVVAGYSLWSNYQTRELERQSDYYVKAQSYLEQGEASKSLALLEELVTGRATYAAFAKFSKAAVLSEAGETQNLDTALNLYQELGDDSRLDRIWRDTAVLRFVSLAFEKDKNQVEVLLEKLEPLCDTGRPLQALAMEQKGLLLFLSGKKDEAAEVFVQIVQLASVPDGLKLRAQIMAQQSSSDM